MDISVHCDINIFDWLIKWVKKDCPPYESPSKLDCGNVIPILVSASFLQMNPLLNDCLEYVHANINAIVKMNINLSCLNDSIISRLGDYFSNLDVEGIKDRKDKIQSRLFCKLILSLSEAEPDERKNHYATIANLFRCGRCFKLITRDIANHILCKPQFMKLTTNGQIFNTHIREQGWTLNDHIRTLYSDLKTWRKVYWRLWADCHNLFCLTCNNHFAVSQADWCSYHPDSPQFFTMEQQRAMSFPIGRYPCCGEKAYRFEPIKNPQCCQYKAHTPLLETDQDKKIHKILEENKNVISIDPPQVTYPEKLIRLVKSPRTDTPEDMADNFPTTNDTFWWKGFEFAPAIPATKKSFLSRLWEKFKEEEKQKRKEPHFEVNNSNRSKKSTAQTPDIMSTSESGELSSPSSITSDSEYDFEISSVGEGEDVTEEKVCQPVRGPSVKVQVLNNFQPKHRMASHFQWKPHLPMRKNQDNQREYEEQAFKAMSMILMRKTCQLSEHQLHSRRSNYCMNNGSHARMEQELTECMTSWTADQTNNVRKSFLYPASSSNTNLACAAPSSSSSNPNFTSL